MISEVRELVKRLEMQEARLSLKTSLQIILSRITDKDMSVGNLTFAWLSSSVLRLLFSNICQTNNLVAYHEEDNVQEHDSLTKYLML